VFIESDEAIALAGEVKQRLVGAGDDGGRCGGENGENGEEVHGGKRKKKGKKKEKLTWAMMSSHGLLLRLFLSPAYFSLHVALKYLLVYADNIGITYYLTRRLRELEVDELNDAWGFIW